MQIFLVGGALRDRLLGVASQDQDFLVVGASPQQMLDAGFRPVGNDFPVFLHPRSQQEYALARTERKSGVGYGGFTFYTHPNISLEEDLIRRDLTINAMAEDDQGVLYDPFGGQRDLAARVLRHVSPAFVEDPLRVLRVARFAAQLAPWNFQVAEETLSLMRQMVDAGELRHLTPERVWQEMEKALKTTRPGEFLAVLQACGALQVLMPAVARLYGVPQHPKHHPEIDTGIHTQMVVNASASLDCPAEDRVALGFAAWVHDVGKGLTPEHLWPHHPGHEIAGVPLVAQICEQYKVPKAVSEFALMVTRWHGEIHQGQDHQDVQRLWSVFQGTDALRRPQRFALLLTLNQADSMGRLGFENAPYVQKDFWQMLLQQVQQVHAQAFIQQGLHGAALGSALQEARLKVIAHSIGADYGQ